MPDINVNLRAKDDASRAFQTAQARLVELRGEIAKLQAKSATVPLDVREVRSVNRMTSEIRSLERGMENLKGDANVRLNVDSSGVDTAQGKIGALLKSGLGGLLPVLSVAGITAATAAVGKFVFSLNTMREEQKRMEVLATTRAGGVKALAAGYREMDAALGGALTHDEKLAQVGQLVSLGLAKSGAEAAQLAKAAVFLGDGAASATQRIESLTQVLVTGRTAGLRDYGIDAQAVNRRVQELKATTEGLSDVELKQIAIKEALATQLERVVAAGGEAVSSVQELKNAWADMLDTAAESVNLEGGIRAIDQTLRSATAQHQMGSDDAATALEGTTKRIQELTAARDKLEAKGALNLIERNNLAFYNEQLAELIPQLDNLAIKTGMARNMGAQNAQALQDQADAAKDLASNLADVSFEGAVWAGNFTNLGTKWVDPHRSRQEAKDAQTRIDADLAGEQIIQGERVARERAAAYERAMTAAASRVQGALSKGISFAVSLAGGSNENDPYAPGKNGPFENIYRAMDVAKLGAASPWAAKLGLTQADAARISSDFQAGLFTEGVQGLIDKEQLIRFLSLDQAAEESSSQFATFLAEKLGPGAASVLNKLGIKTGGTAVPAAPAPATAAATTQINVSIGAGAVQITGGTTLDAANKLAEAIFKALATAESRIGLPAMALAPGAR